MAEFEVGERVRVLPGARSNTEPGGFDYFEDVAGDKTGLVAGGPDDDGDYDVADNDGDYWSFASEFLESIEETPEVKVGDKVRVTREGEVTFVYLSTGNFVLDSGEFVVVRKAEVEILERAYVAPKVGDTLVEGQTYPKGTTIALDTDPAEVLVSDGKGREWRGTAFADGSLGSHLDENRWKIIYIPEEAK